jgi:O-antigen/teichoic acid export membrane protein
MAVGIILVDATGQGQAAPASSRRIAVPWSMARKVGRRLGWGVADQAVSSLTNFAVNIYIARELGAVRYGAFALAYVTYSFALNASRGLATDPLMVRFSFTDLETWRRSVKNCTGTAAVVGFATAALVLAAAALLGGPTRAAFLALGLTLPGLMLQDSWRYSFFALGKGYQAFLNDMIWLVVLVPSLYYLRKTGHGNVFWFVFAWGAAATVAALAGPLQARVVPRLLGAKQWLTSHKDLGVRYLVEGTASSASTQLRNYGIVFVLGLAAMGHVQAATTLMGPFMVLLWGSGLVVLPETTQVWRNSPQRLPLVCVLISIGLTVLGFAWGLALLIALPRGLGAGLLGAIWHPSYPLVLPTTLSLMGACATGGAGTGLHALGAAKRSLRAAMVLAVLYVLGSVGGALTGGAVGAVEGTAIATWLGMLVYWAQLSAALRESGRIPAGHWFWPGRPDGRHRAARRSA